MAETLNGFYVGQKVLVSFNDIGETEVLELDFEDPDEPYRVQGKHAGVWVRPGEIRPLEPAAPGIQWKYRTKWREDSWEDGTASYWRPIPENHTFSEELDYQFRNATPPFVPGYFQRNDEDNGTVQWCTVDPTASGSHYWTRVTVTPAD